MFLLVPAHPGFPGQFHRAVKRLCKTVVCVVCCFVVFSEGPVEVKQKASEAKKMLELWKSSYLETRAKIEASGRDSRWEFDRKILFEKTDHMAVVCEDLYHIAQVYKNGWEISVYTTYAITVLQCFDAVGWAAGRASTL